MGESTFRREERIGLLVASVLHALLVLVLLFRPEVSSDFEPVERMTVNLASEVGMEATAPDPVPESRAATAPTLADSPAPVPELDSPPIPSQPVPAPVERVRTPTPQAARAPDTRPRRRPDPPRTQERAQPAQPTRPAGGSRLGDNFLEGSGSSTRTEETRTPASQIGASTKASLFQAVGRQLRPHWRPVDGADRELLVSRVRFRLNPDGSLAGRPTLISQRGVTDANRPQASRHAENAIRAIQLAAPFDLPEEYYEGWKLVTVDFDWSLSR